MELGIFQWNLQIRRFVFRTSSLQTLRWIYNKVQT